MGLSEASFDLKNGSSMKYVTAGSGSKAMVCVHGLGQSGYIWQRVLEALPPGWQGYAVDLLGFGDSDKPATGYSIAAHARSVREFIESIPQDVVVLAANSLGGVIAVTVALDDADRLAGLVLAATGACVRDPVALARYRERLATMEMTQENRLAIAKNYCHRPQEEEVLSRLAEEVGKARREAMLETMSSSLETDLRPQLGRIALPTLVVQGMEDRGRTPEDGLEIVRGLVDGRLLVLPNVGHTPMLDAPREFQSWLNGVLASWQ